PLGQERLAAQPPLALEAVRAAEGQGDRRGELGRRRDAVEVAGHPDQPLEADPGQAHPTGHAGVPPGEHRLAGAGRPRDQAGHRGGRRQAEEVMRPASTALPTPRTRTRFRRTWLTGYLFISPMLVLFGIYHVYPIVRAFLMSFTNFKYLAPADTRFVGL